MRAECYWRFFPQIGVMMFLMIGCIPARLQAPVFDQGEGEFCGESEENKKDYRCALGLACVEKKCVRQLDASDVISELDASDDTHSVVDLASADASTDELTSDVASDLIYDVWIKDGGNTDVGDIADDLADMRDTAWPVDSVTADGADEEDGVEDMQDVDPDAACTCGPGQKCSLAGGCEVDPSCDSGGALSGVCPPGQSCNSTNGLCQVDPSCNHGGATDGKCPPAKLCLEATGLCEDAEYVSPFGLRFMLIPPGNFQMGSPTGELGRETWEQQHPVALTRAFWMKAYEVTQAEYKLIVGINPSTLSACGDSCPVENVTWYDALYFANKLSLAEGLETC